jgi:hypothetical protein
MDDTCPKCRKPLGLAVIEPHSTRRDLAVHKFDCEDCGCVKTKILFRKQAVVAPELTGSTVSASTQRREFPGSSRLNNSWDFLCHLYEVGRERTGKWLAANFDHLGKESTVDLEAKYF